MKAPAPAWFVEIALNIDEVMLNWKQLEVDGRAITFSEKNRASADWAATEVAKMLGEGGIVRVRHAKREKRGIFFPSPMPARILKGVSL